METNKQTLGGSIIALRQRLNMTQEEFAHAIGVTVSTVNRWENGHVEPSRLARKAMEGLAGQTLGAPEFGHMNSGSAGVDSPGEEVALAGRQKSFSH
jgi:transcriptional regulator with XRE-family HTH domain